jgi:hypothetical protein
MPLFDENGKVVENVLTAEEAEAKAKEAVEAATKKNNESKAGLEAELAKANEALGKAKEGDKNWDALRGAKEELEKKIQGLETRFTEKETAEKTRLSTARDAFLLELVDGKEEEAKKLKLIYDQQTAGAEDTEESIRTRVNNAYVIFKNKAVRSGAFTPSTLSSGGGGSGKPKSGEVIPEEGKELAAQLGVTPAMEKRVAEKRAQKGT